jgi:hypothetical protein
LALGCYKLPRQDIAVQSRDYRRAAEDPAVVQEVAAVLRTHWDPDGVLVRAGGDDIDFYTTHALALAGMVAADAEQPEVARYLRQVEQRLLGSSLHPFKSRYAVSVAVWRTVHGPAVGEAAT